MELWGAKAQRALGCLLCAMAVLGGGPGARAEPPPNLSAGVLHDGTEAADLADAYADSSAQRVLSAAQGKASAAKTPEAVGQPANAASAGSRDRIPLAASLQVVVKELAAQTGVVEAKHFLSAELGLLKPVDMPTDTEADNAPRRRADADTDEDGDGDAEADADAAISAPPRSTEQRKLDGEQASFLASALVQEVVPYAVGAVVLLGCAQGLRVGLAFSRRQTERKRKRRQRRSRSRSSRSTRL